MKFALWWHALCACCSGVWERPAIAELSNISDISRLAASSRRFAQSALAVDLYAGNDLPPGSPTRRSSTRLVKWRPRLEVRKKYGRGSFFTPAGFAVFITGIWKCKVKTKYSLQSVLCYWRLRSSCLFIVYSGWPRSNPVDLTLRVCGNSKFFILLCFCGQPLGLISVSNCVLKRLVI